jgi:hypothetical protein
VFPIGRIKRANRHQCVWLEGADGVIVVVNDGGRRPADALAYGCATRYVWRSRSSPLVSTAGRLAYVMHEVGEPFAEGKPALQLEACHDPALRAAIRRCAEVLHLAILDYSTKSWLMLRSRCEETERTRPVVGGHARVLMQVDLDAVCSIQCAAA